ncbi:hypothetical protein C8R42DRAFT_640052 [Lentinula raphanica]|nr:hypothetical protein C8R42DRAFT_640052 [Lentinula raphanica]
MTRSTTRALAILLLGGAISSDVLAAPTSISPRSMSSTQHARLGLLSGSGPTPKVVPHQRRLVEHANVVPQRVDGDEFTATQNLERNSKDGDTHVSVFVNLEDRAGSGTHAESANDEPQDVRRLQILKTRVEKAIANSTDSSIRLGLISDLNSLIEDKDTSEAVQDDARTEIGRLDAELKRRKKRKDNDRVETWRTTGMELLPDDQSKY